LSGLAGIIFFGFVGFYLLKKLFNKKPGLIISNSGIVDNSSGISVGFIPWSDIKEIKETMVAKSETPTVVESHGILSANEQIMNFFIYIRLTVPADGP
jgi:hypothetical protein